MPSPSGSGRHEELELHLLELARAEHEVAGRDLVAEGLADLRDAERRLLARGLATSLKSTKMPCAVSGRRYAIDDASSIAPIDVLNIMLKCARLGERRVAARRAAVAREMIGAPSLLAGLAVHHLVVEILEMPGRAPDVGRHEDGGVDADDVVAQLDVVAPPRLADVALELDAERPVVPRAVDAAVDLARLEYETAALARAP